MCFVVFLQAIEDVVDGGAHGVYLTFAGGAVLSEFAASRPAWGRCAALCLPGAGDWVCRGFFKLPRGWVCFAAPASLRRSAQCPSRLMRCTRVGCSVHDAYAFVEFRSAFAVVALPVMVQLEFLGGSSRRG